MTWIRRYKGQHNRLHYHLRLTPPRKKHVQTTDNTGTMYTAWHIVQAHKMMMFNQVGLTYVLTFFLFRLLFVKENQNKNITTYQQNYNLIDQRNETWLLIWTKLSFFAYYDRSCHILDILNLRAYLILH